MNCDGTSGVTDFEESAITKRLARRVADARPTILRISLHGGTLPEGLIPHLRERLSAGETHYTTRPGIVELRHTIAREIESMGGPELDADGVVVTHGEAEALFVTLLGLGIGTGASVISRGQCRHRELFESMGIDLVEHGDPRVSQAKAVYHQTDSKGERPLHVAAEPQAILALGDMLFSQCSGRAGPLRNTTQSIMIGHLDTLPGMDLFRLGYAAGPPELVKGITTWKQAFSICSAAPSQRAAMFAISKEAAP